MDMDGRDAGAREKIGLEQGLKNGIAQGITKGELTGDIRGRRNDALRMRADGLPVEKIAQYVGETVDTVQEWFQEESVLV